MPRHRTGVLLNNVDNEGGFWYTFNTQRREENTLLTGWNPGLLRSHCLLLAAVIVASAVSIAGAAPMIQVSDNLVYNIELVPPGGSWSRTITVRNIGDSPLTVSRIGMEDRTWYGYNPRGWLSVSDTELYILPGLENARELEIYVDASAYDFPFGLSGKVYLKSDAANNDSLNITVWVNLESTDTTILWGLLGTDDNMYGPWEPDRVCVGLIGSSGGAFGLPGWCGMHMDYAESGLECGTRDADQIYLLSGSPFVMVNEGGSVSLTVSNYQSGVVKAHHWQSASGSPVLDYGFADGYGSYYYMKTGVLVSREGYLAMERTYIAPLTPEGHTVYMLVLTEVYSADGLPHDHVTIGSVTDWDIPSDRVGINTSGTAAVTPNVYPISFIYAQGTDTVGSVACQSNTSRFGTEVLLWTPWGGFAGPQALMRDTNLSRAGEPLSPAQPDGEAWWEEVSSHPGFHADPVEGNQAVWLTFAHDITIDADETLHIWSVLTTVRDGTVSDLQKQVALADLFLSLRLSPCCACCLGRVGDANGHGFYYGPGDPRNNDVTISDIATILDALFVTGNFYHIVCMDEADVNNNGGCCSQTWHVTISDVSILVDHLFISGPQNSELQPCEWW